MAVLNGKRVESRNKEEMHIEDVIRENGVYVSTTAGVSMHPMLRNRRDTIMIKPVTGRLEKYDVPLYRRGKDYVLHRIVAVKPEGYVICGDNCMRKEYNITDQQIIGVLRGFYRDGKKIDMNGWKYHLYCRVWVALYSVRYAVKLVVYGMKKVAKTCLKIDSGKK